MYPAEGYTFGSPSFNALISSQKQQLSSAAKYTLTAGMTPSLKKNFLSLSKIFKFANKKNFDRPNAYKEGLWNQLKA